jgi:hypothetical protein
VLPTSETLTSTEASPTNVKNAPWSKSWPRGIIFKLENVNKGDSSMENTQDTLHQDSSKTIRINAEISAKEFTDFYSFLNIIKSDFKDFCLVDGGFRARSNDLTCVVETGFSFFNGMHFNIVDCKWFIKMISALEKNTTITVEVTESGVTFSDHYQSIEIPSSLPEYIDNKYVTDEEMEKIFIENMDSEKLLVDDTIQQKKVSKIIKISRDLNTHSFSIKHDKNDLNKGLIYISNASRKYAMKLNKNLLTPMKKNHYINLSFIPFLFNKDDVSMKLYYTNEPIFIVVYDTKVNDIFVNIYARGGLVEETNN